jgi:hypothetical protein
VPSFLTGLGGAPQRIAVGLGQVGQVQPEDLGEYGEPLRRLVTSTSVARSPWRRTLRLTMRSAPVASRRPRMMFWTNLESGDVDSVAWL